MMSALAYERVHGNLKHLKLTTIESLLDNYLEIAAKEERSTLEVLDYLFDQELKSREDRALTLRIQLVGFPMEKRLDDFDMKFPPSIESRRDQRSCFFTIRSPYRECGISRTPRGRKDPSRVSPRF